MATSGSTGMPFEFYWDRAAGDMVRGAYLLSLEWAGAALWDARIMIASPAYFYNQIAPVPRWRLLAGRLVLGEESVSLSADTLTTARFRALVGEVSRRKHYFIRGYPAPIARLASRLLDEGGPLAGYPLVVISFAETLTPSNASTIEAALRCRVVNYYSSWEVPQMAQTCPDNPDLLHVNADRVILRVVRDDGSDAAPGETGRVVVTDLANYVMPFINYGNGDQAVAGDACPCGRGLPTLIRLEGRDSEVLRNPQGREINGVVLGQFLAFVAGVIPCVLEYQAVQSSANRVRLLVIPSDRFTPEFGEKLRTDLEAFIGPGMQVTVETVDRIPLEPSGKRLLVKQLEGPRRRDIPSPGPASTATLPPAS
jgi:phenylacetate-CoA ligase